jgi:hypothetical protein
VREREPNGKRKGEADEWRGGAPIDMHPYASSNWAPLHSYTIIHHR